MKRISSVTKLILTLVIMIAAVGFAPAFAENETVVSVSAAVTAEDFIASGYDINGAEIMTGDDTVQINGRTYSTSIIMKGAYKNNAHISFDVSKIKRLSFATSVIDNKDTDVRNGKLLVSADGQIIKELSISNHPEYHITDLDLSEKKVMTITLEQTEIALVDFSVDHKEGKTVSTEKVPTFKSSTDFVKSVFNCKGAEVVTKADSEPITINNCLYNEGIILRKTASFNVEKINTIAFSAGFSKIINDSVKISVYADSDLIAEADIGADSPTMSFSLDLNNRSVLKFVLSDYSYVGLVEFSLDGKATKCVTTAPQYHNIVDVVNGIFDDHFAYTTTGVDEDKVFKMEDGTIFNKGIRMQYDDLDGVFAQHRNASFKINTVNIKKLMFCGHSKTDAQLSIYGDGNLFATIDLNTEQKRYIIDLSNISLLHFTTTSETCVDVIEPQPNPVDIPSDVIVINNPILMANVDPSLVSILSSAKNPSNAEVVYGEKAITLKDKKTYGTGIVFSAQLNENSEITLNTSDIDSLSFTLGKTDASPFGAEFIITPEGKSPKTITVDSSSKPEVQTVELKGVNSLKLELKYKGTNPGSVTAVAAGMKVKLSAEAADAEKQSPASTISDSTVKEMLPQMLYAIGFIAAVVIILYLRTTKKRRANRTKNIIINTAIILISSAVNAYLFYIIVIFSVNKDKKLDGFVPFDQFMGYFSNKLLLLVLCGNLLLIAILHPVMIYITSKKNVSANNQNRSQGYTVREIGEKRQKPPKLTPEQKKIQKLRSNADSGDIYAQLKLANFYLKKKDYTTAKALYLKTADSGDKDIIKKVIKAARKFPPDYRSDLIEAALNNAKSFKPT